MAAIGRGPSLESGDSPRLSADRFSSGNRRKLSGPALRTFLNIAREWRLNESDKLHVLGLPARSTFHSWVAKTQEMRQITLPLDVLIRISAVLGIFKALQILFAAETEATAWLHTPNRAPCFGGQRPIDLITSGTQDGIMLARRYLDSWRGGTFAAPTGADFERRRWTGDDIVIVE